MASSSSLSTDNATETASATDTLSTPTLLSSGAVSCTGTGGNSSLTLDQSQSQTQSQQCQLLKVSGTIVRRRSMGKQLAFADIQTATAATGACTATATATVGAEINPSRPCPTDDNNGIVRVAFRRKSPSWNTARDETFPIKNSALPYGAKVELYVVVVVADAGDVDAQTKSNAKAKANDTTTDAETSLPQQQRQQQLPAPFDVHSWVVLVNPSETALKQAATTDSNGIREGVSCSTYLKARQESFRSAQSQLTMVPTVPINTGTTTRKRKDRDNKDDNSMPNKASLRNSDPRAAQPQPHPSLASASASAPHGDKKHKALRARIFASWLITEVLGGLSVNGNVNVDTAKAAASVLDIAGGKGQLSIELSTQTAGIYCTVIDPLVRKRGMHMNMNSSSSVNSSIIRGHVGLSSKDKKRLHKVGATQPLHVARPFGDALLKIPEYDTLVKQASILVGLHPDECTEDILDTALLYGKAVAIVPCCVFPQMFPDRYLAGRPHIPVTTYEEFLQYLLEKDERLQRATLPFEGRNQVIYCTTFK
jgi:hypothetical protein